MAKRKNNFILPSFTKVDVVARRGEEIIVKEMTLVEAQSIRKKKSWKYDIFQLGFHTYKPTKK